MMMRKRGDDVMTLNYHALNNTDSAMMRTESNCSDESFGSRELQRIMQKARGESEVPQAAEGLRQPLDGTAVGKPYRSYQTMIHYIGSYS